MSTDPVMQPNMAHNEEPRFQVVPFSQSSHCCFAASVLDTTKPQILGDEHYRDNRGYLHYATVCECFDSADAVRIANALNKE